MRPVNVQVLFPGNNAAAFKFKLGMGNDEAMYGTAVSVGFQPTGVARQGNAQ